MWCSCLKWYFTETSYIVSTLSASTNTAIIVHVFFVSFLWQVLTKRERELEGGKGKIEEAHRYQWPCLRWNFNSVSIFMKKIKGITRYPLQARRLGCMSLLEDISSDGVLYTSSSCPTWIYWVFLITIEDMYYSHISYFTYFVSVIKHSASAPKLHRMDAEVQVTSIRTALCGVRVNAD